MSQSIVTIRLNGQPYQMGCDAGQEDHIETLGREVDGVISQLTQSVGQIGEARLLAMAALIIADRKPEKGSAAWPLHLLTGLCPWTSLTRLPNSLKRWQAGLISSTHSLLNCLECPISRDVAAGLRARHFNPWDHNLL